MPQRTRFGISLVMFDGISPYMEPSIPEKRCISIEMYRCEFRCCPMNNRWDFCEDRATKLHFINLFVFLQITTNNKTLVQREFTL